MNIIINFLIGAIIMYIAMGAIWYILEEDIRYIPKGFRLGARIGAILAILIGIAILGLVAYAIGTAIVNTLT